jgi:hypothetical protein
MAPKWGIAVGDENPPKNFLCASINEILHGHIFDKLVKPLWIKNQQWLLNLAR